MTNLKVDPTPPWYDLYIRKSWWTLFWLPFGLCLLYVACALSLETLRFAYWAVTTSVALSVILFLAVIPMTLLCAPLYLAFAAPAMLGGWWSENQEMEKYEKAVKLGGLALLAFYGPAIFSGLSMGMLERLYFIVL